MRSIWQIVVLTSLACVSCVTSDPGILADLAADSLDTSTEEKSCTIYGEGCGEIERLSDKTLDPNCGVANAGKSVEISGTFAAQWDYKQTVDPPLYDAQLMSVEDLGYVIFEPSATKPDEIVKHKRRYCASKSSKIAGVSSKFPTQLFYTLPTFSYDYNADDAGLVVGEPLTLQKGWTTWGLSDDFDPFTMDVPKDKGNRRVIDGDGDGHPGVTIINDAKVDTLDGDYYIVAGMTFVEELKICSAERLQGNFGKQTRQQATVDAKIGTDASLVTLETPIAPKRGTIFYTKLNDSLKVREDHDGICEQVIKQQATLFSAPVVEDSAEGSE